MSNPHESAFYKALPRDPRMVAQEKENHRRAQAEKPSPAIMELLPDPHALDNFIEEHSGELARLNKDDEGVDLDPIQSDGKERLVMPMLYEARSETDPDDQRLQEIREALWGNSWHKHKTHNPEKCAGIAEKLRGQVLRQQNEVQRTDPQDAKRFDDDIARMDEVIRVLREHATGAIVEAAARTIEDWYVHDLKESSSAYYGPARKEAKKELEAVRLIRDELYYSLLFPRMAAARISAMQKTFERRAKK
jgi:hypothetical protein